LGRRGSERNGCPYVFVAQRREVSQNLGCCGAFGQTGKHCPQGYSCALKDWLAADHTRVALDVIAIVHGHIYFSASAFPFACVSHRITASSGRQVLPWIKLNFGEGQG
jgi:hypothetical protein